MLQPASNPIRNLPVLEQIHNNQLCHHTGLHSPEVSLMTEKKVLGDEYIPYIF